MFVWSTDCCFQKKFVFVFFKAELNDWKICINFKISTGRFSKFGLEIVEKAKISEVIEAMKKN